MTNQPNPIVHKGKGTGGNIQCVINGVHYQGHPPCPLNSNSADMTSLNNSICGIPANKPVKGKVVYRNLTGTAITPTDIDAIRTRIANLTNQIALAAETPGRGILADQAWLAANSNLPDGDANKTRIQDDIIQIQRNVVKWKDDLAQAQLDLAQAITNLSDQAISQMTPEQKAQLAKDQANLAAASQLKKWLIIAGVGIGTLAAGVGIWAWVRSIKAKKVKVA